MHVFQVCPEFPFHGGVERHVLELSRSLRNFKVDVTVVTTNPSGHLLNHEYYDGIEIVRFRCLNPSESYYVAPSMLTYLAKIREAQTVVHCHNYQASPALMAALAKSLNNLPLVFTPHFHPVGGTKFRSAVKTLYRPIGKLVFAASDAVVVLSDYERALLKAVFRLDSKKIHVIPPGIDPISITERRPSHNILYVGRLEKYKGIGLLIESLPNVIEHLPEVTLTIVGSGPDEARLRKLVMAKGFSRFVTFLGNVSSYRLNQLLMNAGLVALISEYKAYSLIISEALQRGIPVVTTRVGAIPEIYGNHPRCVLLDYPPPADRLAEEISTLLSANWNTRAKNIPIEAWGFPWSEVAHRVVNLYNKCLQGQEDEDAGSCI